MNSDPLTAYPRAPGLRSWSVAQLAEAAGGRLLGAGRDLTEWRSRLVRSISTDTRKLEEGDAFLALAGERFDGHAFLPQALERGAVAVIVQDGRRLPSAWPQELAVIEVPDTLYALGELARDHHRRHPVPVLGITGSNGKTTTKEMAASILGHKRRILKNEGNFNNLVGAPMTLLGLGPEHEAAVLELGINVPGEMARLAEIVEPVAGLVTNIHPAHLEGLRSVEGVLKEKGKLWEFLKESGSCQALAVVNLDDALLKDFALSLNLPSVSYSSRDQAALVHLEGEVVCDGRTTRFQMHVGGRLVPVRLPSVGKHHVQNALAAAAAAYAMGEAPEEIAEGLSRFRAVPGRMQLRDLADGTTLIDDTYNANPMSTLAAVETLCEGGFDLRGGSRGCGTSQKKVAVLGEMRELGEESAALHRRLGLRIASLGLDRLITLGDLAAEIGRGACEGGMDIAQCYHAGNHEDAAAHLKGHWPRGGRILVKGSRGMTMEKVVEEILAFKLQRLGG